jgi:hypothetical protein
MQRLNEAIESAIHALKNNSFSTFKQNSYEYVEGLVNHFNGKIEIIPDQEWHHPSHVDGLIIKNSDKRFTIKIPENCTKYPKNSPEAMRRRSFIVLHELGHYLTHLKTNQLKVFQDTVMFRKNMDNTDQIEVEAEAFALLVSILNSETFVDDYQSKTLDEMIEKYHLNEDKIEYIFTLIQSADTNGIELPL